MSEFRGLCVIETSGFRGFHCVAGIVWKACLCILTPSSSLVGFYESKLAGESEPRIVLIITDVSRGLGMPHMIRKFHNMFMTE